MVSQADLVAAVSRLQEKIAPEIPIRRVVLFGSQARGDAGPESDVDLIVVSEAFAGKSAAWRAYPLRRAWDLKLPVDFLCYTPEEFDALSRRTTIVRLALDEGRDLLASST